MRVPLFFCQYILSGIMSKNSVLLFMTALTLKTGKVLSLNLIKKKTQ